MKKFWELFSISHKQFLAQIKEYLPYGLFFGLVSLLTNFPYDHFEIDLQSDFRGILFSFVSLVLTFMAVIKIYLKEGQKLGLLTEQNEGFWVYFLTSFLHFIYFTLVMIAGLFLLIIPGLIFSIYFYFVPMASIFENENTIGKTNYFRWSFNLVKGNVSLITCIYMSFLFLELIALLIGLISNFQLRVGAGIGMAILDGYFYLLLNMVAIRSYSFLAKNKRTSQENNTSLPI